MFCRYCGQEMHETASECPRCGGRHHPLPSRRRPGDGTMGVPIASLVLGIVCMAALLDDSPWDRPTLLGLAYGSGLGLFLGALSLQRQHTGRGLAIAGVVLSSIGLLAFMGLSAH